MLTPAAIESRVLEQWTQLRERQSSHPLEPARVVIAEMMCLGYKPKYMHGVVQRAGIAVSYSVLWKWIKRTFGSGQARIPCARAILQQAVDADLFVSSVVRKSSVMAPIGVSVPNAISSLTHPPRPQAPSAAANLAKRRQGDVGAGHPHQRRTRSPRPGHRHRTEYQTPLLPTVSRRLMRPRTRSQLLRRRFGKNVCESSRKPFATTTPHSNVSMNVNRKKEKSLNESSRTELLRQRGQDHDRQASADSPHGQLSVAPG